MSRPKLFQVLPSDDFAVFLSCDNGEIRRYDCRWFLDRGGVFTQLGDRERFSSTCTIINGTLGWDITGARDPYDCIDICPDTIYEESVRTCNPLSESA